MTTTGIYIGIDISKATLEVATCAGRLIEVPNTSAGHVRLLERLRAQSIACVVIESTGIYGRELVRSLHAAGYAVAVVQPGRVRHFALSRNLLAKTDRLDAVMIARFGAEVKPRLWEMPRAPVERLRAINDRRSQVIDDRVREENRLEACRDERIAKDLRASIKRLNKAEEKLDRETAALIAADADMAAMSAALQEESGVGPQTSAVLLSQLPELGKVNRQQISALAGVAPYNHSSGPKDGRRRIFGGKAQVRRALYLAAVSGARWNTYLKEFYQRLVAQGKDKKLTLIACARKLIVRLNTIAATALAKRAPQSTVTA